MRPRPEMHGRNRLRDDRDVEPDRPVLEVGEVEPDEIVEREARASGDLPEPGHPGEHEIPGAMPVLEELVVAKRQRPRPDEAHLAPQRVDELRQLVDREPPQNSPDPRHPRVVADLEQRARRLVRVLERALLRRCARDHRAELQHPELALADADPAVDVEHGPSRVELDRKRDEQPERQAEHDDQTRCRPRRTRASPSSPTPSGSVGAGRRAARRGPARTRPSGRAARSCWERVAPSHRRGGPARPRPAPSARRSRPPRGSPRRADAAREPGRARRPTSRAREAPRSRLGGDGAEELVADLALRRSQLAVQAQRGSPPRRRESPGGERRPPSSPRARTTSRQREGARSRASR